MSRLGTQLVHLLLIGGTLPLVGCGTTRYSDTARAATEQLLVSDAIDRAVQSLNVTTLRGQKVFLDDSRLADATDKNYLISTLRQYLLANGCYLREKREDADFIVEARAGAVGTDRNDLLFGIPSMNVPQIMPLQPVPAAIPEVPVAKRRHQRGIVKIALFAFHRETGTPVWQSGIAMQESSANDVWILGAGPFQRGTIHAGTEFAGKTLREGEDGTSPTRLPPTDLARASTFTSPQKLAHKEEPAPAAAAAAPEQPVVQAQHTEPQPVAEAPAATPTKSDTPAPPPANAAAPPAAAPENQPAAVPAAAAQTPPATPPAPSAAAAPPAGGASATTAPPPTTSVYAPAGTSPLPHPRFESP